MNDESARNDNVQENSNKIIGDRILLNALKGIEERINLSEKFSDELSTLINELGSDSEPSTAFTTTENSISNNNNDNSERVVQHALTKERAELELSHQREQLKFLKNILDDSLKEKIQKVAQDIRNGTLNGPVHKSKSHVYKDEIILNSDSKNPEKALNKQQSERDLKNSNCSASKTGQRSLGDKDRKKDK